MKKINIDIQTNGGTKTVEAWTPNSKSALAVNLSTRKEAGLDKKMGWAVTHIISGMAIATKIKTKSEAIQLARILGNRSEWNLIGDDGDLTNFPSSMKREVLAITENIKYGRPIVRF